MKKMFFGASALVAALFMVGCSSEDDLALSPPVVQEAETPILFSSNKGNFTRAALEGADAAKALGNQFVVSGYKGPKSEWDASESVIVFDNYTVKWTENTAHTTQSNTTNWEYVGVDRNPHAIANGVTQQAIKYWDYTRSQYDFIAWSTGEKTVIYDDTDLSNGQVRVSAITPETATGASGVAYTIEGKADDLVGCYVADLVTVKKESGKYGEPVTLEFRSLGTKVRIGIYETIPGYSVRNVKFYSGAATDDADTATPRIFTITADNNIYTEGTYTIFFPTVDTPDDSDNNQAHIKFAGKSGSTQSTVVDFGGLNYTIAEDGEKTPGSVYLGRTSNTATFAGNADNNYYTQYLPNEEKGLNLNLRVDYTLESIDGSGETIDVRGATAQVPSIYATWKAGYAYTYLFKISDKTNGHTGDYNPLYPDDTTINSDPAGLYPITFDALVVNDEDNENTQETITLVSTPSFTTYQEGSNVVNNDEYTADNPIYVTVSDGKTENTPDLANGQLIKLTADNAKLYTIPAGKTEAEVIDAIQMQDDDAEAGTIKGRSGLVLTDAETTANLKRTSQIKYGVDGNIITVGSGKVAKFTPTANTTYAFVYTKTAPTTTEEKFQPVNKAKGQSVAGLYRAALKNAPEGDVQKDVTYFESSSKDAVKVFVGQTVDNLYLDNKGESIAKGYAVSGTTYYYTTNYGMSYIPAHNVAYEDFATGTSTAADLYTFDGTDYTANSDTEPVDGTAYYQQTGAGTSDDPYVYTYCVILPQQTNPTGGTRLKVIDPTAAKLECSPSMKAVEGMQYFDKYTSNDGVYYTKVIKVQ